MAKESAISLSSFLNMAIAIKCLGLLTLLTYQVICSGICTPNTQLLLNGKTCNCDSEGKWIEAHCSSIELHKACIPGKISHEGCKRCFCKENGQLECADTDCALNDETLDFEKFTTVNFWCTPFGSYYVNCSLCVCPASGRFSDARCVKDTSCKLKDKPTLTQLSDQKRTCIPKVMYLFQCLHCICSDDGLFDKDKCVETCQETRTDQDQRCNPNTFYRKDCNVCLCPQHGVTDEKYCTKDVCREKLHFLKLEDLKINKSFSCRAHHFVKKRCIYCSCSANGTLDERNCLELECLNDYKYNVLKEKCNKNEMIPLCTECLCLGTGQLNGKYCSKACSYESKLAVLEDVVQNIEKDIGSQLIDKALLSKTSQSRSCDPDSIYIDQGRVCLCPGNGYYDFNFCTSKKQGTSVRTNPKVDNKVEINKDITCVPNTFIEFDCNTCFCTKKGMIDPKWCTFDDCEAKKLITQSHKTSTFRLHEPEISKHCNPGSISKVDCNFCICPNSGYAKDRVCTKNDCTLSTAFTENDSFTCEPLVYYEVDCNICFCPRDGLKNVAKCTKNHCEKNYLRSSDVCVPSQLFSEGCNVCVCPPNGKKSDKACTNNTCSDTASWKNIYLLSESLLGAASQVSEDATRSLDVCFPGEEFVMGCKLCVCPDMGLKVYALCSLMLCEDVRKTDNLEVTGPFQKGDNKNTSAISMIEEPCSSYNNTKHPELGACLPRDIWGKE